MADLRVDDVKLSLNKPFAVQNTLTLEGGKRQEARAIQIARDQPVLNEQSKRSQNKPTTCSCASECDVMFTGR